MSIDRLPLQVLGLSSREEEILRLICRGLSNQEIARSLFLSTNTIKTYIRSAYRKIGVETRTQAVLWGIDHGLDPRGTSETRGTGHEGARAGGDGRALPPTVSDHGRGCANESENGPDDGGPAVREVAAILGHDMGTPLTVIRAATEEALAYLDDPDLVPGRGGREAAVRGCLDVVLRGTHNLEGLRDGVTTWLRLDHGVLRSRAEDVQVRAHLESAVVLAPDPTRVSVRCDETLLCHVQPGHLDQILANLVTNAHKYGHGAIRLRAHRTDEHVRITVADDGAGVDPEFRAELFEPFTRHATAAGVPGTGLGLHVVRRLARANHGDVTYTPGPDGGSVFTVILPARQVTDRTTVDEAARQS